MNRITSSAFFLMMTSLLLLSSACSTDEICTRGEGPIDTLAISLPTFTGIDLKVSGNVYLRQGEQQQVTVLGQSNIVDRLKLDVDDLTWKIDLRGCNRDYESLEFYITLPELDYVKVSGSGDVFGETEFEVDDLDVLLSGSGNVALGLRADYVYTKISGSGNIDLALSATQLQSEISGAGDLRFQGEVPTHLCEIRGSGEILAFELFTETTDIDIRGSGNAELYARDVLDVDITGSGNVRYQGTPTINLDVDGSGRLIDAN